MTITKVFSKDAIPHFAFTLGIGTILESTHAMILADGAKKAGIVAKALEEPVTSQITASPIQLHQGKATGILGSDRRFKNYPLVL